MRSSTHLSLHVTPTPEALAQVTAQLLVDQCTQSIAERGHFTLALSGGSTPRALFHLLASEPYRSTIPWEKVEFYWVDERCVDPDSPESNYRVARDELLHMVSATKFYRIKGELDPAEAAQAYDHLLRQHFELGSGELPRFDCALLGMGEDGHIASLFPGEDGLDITDRLVIDQRVRALKSDRISLTLPVLNNARCCLFMVQGARKHAALSKALDLLATPELPAQRIRPTNGALIWVIDDAARTGKEK